MDSRGRSRDVSPIALARQRLQADHPHLYPPVNLFSTSNLTCTSPPHDHHTTPVAKSRSTTPTTRSSHTMSIHHPPPPSQPVASSSKLPSLSYYPSSSSSSSPPASASLSTSPSEAPPPFMRTLSSSTLSVSPDPSAVEPLTPPEYPYSGADPRALDYYDSPPSPPRTLQDQMQVAYALDNMHLAKILLLKLQGIEVTSDSDPRIAQVNDADFNDAFVPPGGLHLDEDIEWQCREAERRELQRRKRRAREERLKVCERIWESSIRTLREEKEKLARRKDDRLRERRRSLLEAREREREAREREAERAHASTSTTSSPFLRSPHGGPLRLPTHPTHRAVLSYGSLPASSSRAPPLSVSKSPPRARQQHADASTSFQYAIMQPPRSPPASSSRLLSASPKSPLHAYNEFAVQSRSVAFSDVVASMNGPLFPLGTEEEERAAMGKNAAQAKLFDELLRPCRWDGEESLSPIRAKDSRGRMQARRRTTDECIACSVGSASSSSSSGFSSSRTAVSESARTETTIRSPASHTSWFAFSVRSSISTLLTTPSLSPKSLSKDVDVHVSVEEVHDDVLAHAAPLRHSCPHALRVAVDQHPLLPSSPIRSKPTITIAPVSGNSASSRTLVSSPTSPHTPRSPSVSSRTTSISSQQSQSPNLMMRVSHKVSKLLDMATSFQRAYVTATMFNTGVDGYGYEYEWDERSRSRSRSRSVSIVSRNRRKGGGRGWRARPEGYRAAPGDVCVFISPPPPPPSTTSPVVASSSSESQVQLNRPLIPLHPLTLSSSSSSSSAYPSPIIERKLPTPTQPPRSPFRLPYTPPTVTSRLRPIANPLLLRVRALQNCGGSGVVGVQEVKEVKEKMVGVAWEGIGRSGLGWEVRVC